MRAYVEFEIEEGAYEISCPDAQCDHDAMLSLREISSLVSSELMEKHCKFRLNRGKSLLISYFFYQMIDASLLYKK
jgi:E3 ubiquitin-protein ligase RNF144